MKDEQPNKLYLYWLELRYVEVNVVVSPFLRMDVWVSSCVPVTENVVIDVQHSRYGFNVLQYCDVPQYTGQSVSSASQCPKQ